MDEVIQKYFENENNFDKVNDRCICVHHYGINKIYRIEVIEDKENSNIIEVKNKDELDSLLYNAKCNAKCNANYAAESFINNIDFVGQKYFISFKPAMSFT